MGQTDSVFSSSLPPPSTRRTGRHAVHFEVLFVFFAAVLFAACGGSGKSPAPLDVARATESPALSTQPPGGALGASSAALLPLRYNASRACINHVVYSNDVLPSGKGEFGTNGLDRAYWGGTKTRTYPPTTTWGPGFYPSWGRTQYDTYFGDSSDGTGYDPFHVGADTAVSGSPRGVRIEAMPVPAPIATSLTVVANSQWVVTSATAAFSVPSEGGSLTVDVSNVNSAHDNWKVGIGDRGAAITFIGTLTHGGASNEGTGGSNPWTISKIHVYSGKPGTKILPGSNDEGGFRAYSWPQYYSGALDMNVNQEYGFFVARVRLPQPHPAISPAFWMIETGGVGTNRGQSLKSEWDIQEQFAADYGYQLNAGNILWNSGTPGISYGCGLHCPETNNTKESGATGVYSLPAGVNYSSNYHDYGVLISRGGPSFPTNYSGSAGGNYVENGSPWVGTTFFLDGRPIAGHVGGPDLTQQSPDKEIMAMFQIGAPGSWLDPSSQGMSNPWPQYMWIQWIRIYKPTTESC